MKLVSKRGRRLPLPKANGTWPFPTGTPPQGGAPPDILLDEDQDPPEGLLDEVIEKTSRGVDINYAEFEYDADSGLIIVECDDDDFISVDGD